MKILLTGFLRKKSDSAPIRGMSPISGSRITLIVPWIWERETEKDNGIEFSLSLNIIYSLAMLTVLIHKVPNFGRITYFIFIFMYKTSSKSIKLYIRIKCLDLQIHFINLKGDGRLIDEARIRSNDQKLERRKFHTNI